MVQAQAEVLYLIRAPEMADAQQIYARIEKIARGAAMMTETTVECRFDKACSSYLPNRTLEAAMYRALQHYGTPARRKRNANLPVKSAPRSRQTTCKTA